MKELFKDLFDAMAAYDPINFCGPPSPLPKNCWEDGDTCWHAKDEETAKLIGGEAYDDYHRKYA